MKYFGKCSTKCLTNTCLSTGTQRERWQETFTSSKTHITVVSQITTTKSHKKLWGEHPGHSFYKEHPGFWMRKEERCCTRLAYALTEYSFLMKQLSATSPSLTRYKHESEKIIQIGNPRPFNKVSSYCIISKTSIIEQLFVPRLQASCQPVRYILATTELLKVRCNHWHVS